MPKTLEFLEAPQPVSERLSLEMLICAFGASVKVFGKLQSRDDEIHHPKVVSQRTMIEVTLSPCSELEKPSKICSDEKPQCANSTAGATVCCLSAACPAEADNLWIG